MRISILVTAFILTFSPSLLAQPLRIGIFDSRAVALAWYNSAEGKKDAGALHGELAAAKKRGDRRSTEKVEALGFAYQQLKHQQVFGNGSILNLNAALRGRFEAAAKTAGVPVIVSKWEIAWRDPAVEYVDVTDALIDLMKPEPKVRAWIDGMKEHDPLPLAEALAIRD